MLESTRPLLSGAIATTPQKTLNRRPKKRSVEPRKMPLVPRRSGKLESLEVFIAGALHPPMARRPVSIGKQRSPGCRRRRMPIKLSEQSVLQITLRKYRRYRDHIKLIRLQSLQIVLANSF